MTKSRLEHLNKVAKKIEKHFRGYTKDDSEYLFTKIVPIYLFQSRTLNKPTDYLIVNRETGEEVKTPSSYHPL